MPRHNQQMVDVVWTKSHQLDGFNLEQIDAREHLAHEGAIATIEEDEAKRKVAIGFARYPTEEDYEAAGVGEGERTAPPPAAPRTRSRDPRPRTRATGTRGRGSRN